MNNLAQQTPVQQPITNKAYGINGAPIPQELKRWNWGAFFLTWIWGIGNHIWFTFLALIIGFGLPWILMGPVNKIFIDQETIGIRRLLLTFIVQLIIGIIFGIYGNRWAWRFRKIDNVSQYLSSERSWEVIGLIIAFLYIVCSIILYALSSISSAIT